MLTTVSLNLASYVQLFQQFLAGFIQDVLSLVFLVFKVVSVFALRLYFLSGFLLDVRNRYVSFWLRQLSVKNLELSSRYRILHAFD